MHSIVIYTQILLLFSDIFCYAYVQENIIIIIKFHSSGANK